MPEKRIGNGLSRASRGFTFVEMMVCLVVLAVGFSAFLGLTLQTMRDFDFYSSANQVSQWNQEIVNKIRNDTLSTKEYFENDAMGQDYFLALQFPQDSPPLTSLRLPTIEEEGTFERDTNGNEKTGNSLFFVKTLTPFVWTDDTGTYTYRINRYCFMLYYLTWRMQEPIGDHADSLDLIRLSSVPMADYGQVMSIEDTDLRRELVEDFVGSGEEGSHYLWDSGRVVDLAFHYCDDEGNVSINPEMNMVIPLGGHEGLFSGIDGGGGRMQVKRASICLNDGTPGFESGPIVPQFGLADLTGDGFPHGFEAQLIGPSGARKLLIRLALAKEASRHVIGKANKAILTTRDF